MANREQPPRLTVISTWHFGMPANVAAWQALQRGGAALDAVEQGVRVCEADENVMSVGYGGLPDREGHVTLDACVMDHRGQCGAVCYLPNIKHAVSVARLVMERTPHIMLAGEGAMRLALQNGLEKENLLTEKARQRWLKWKATQAADDLKLDNVGHDTIGMLALDSQGNVSGACTTSGLAWKHHGRVGDSPIIGAGLYVDNEVGAATATGRGSPSRRRIHPRERASRSSKLSARASKRLARARSCGRSRACLKKTSRRRSIRSGTLPRSRDRFARARARNLLR